MIISGCQKWWELGVLIIFPLRWKFENAHSKRKLNLGAGVAQTIPRVGGAADGGMEQVRGALGSDRSPEAWRRRAYVTIPTLTHCT